MESSQLTPTADAPPAVETSFQNAFLERFLPLQPRLSRYVRAMTRDVEEAKDVEAETVLRAFENVERIRDVQALLSFLFTTARRILIRQRKRRTLFRPLDEMIATQIPDLGSSPEESADARLLYDAMEHLPVRQREALALFEFSDLAMEDIRKIQGGTLSGVKARVARARRRLAVVLKVDDAH